MLHIIETKSITKTQKNYQNLQKDKLKLKQNYVYYYSGASVIQHRWGQ